MGAIAVPLVIGSNREVVTHPGAPAYTKVEGCDPSTGLDTTDVIVPLIEIITGKVGVGGFSTDPSPDRFNTTPSVDR